MKNTQGRDEVQAPGAKKKYTVPRVARFGNVTLITRGGSGKGADAGVGGPQTQTRMCWIAEALYGAETPRVLLVRAWLTETYQRRDPMALILVSLYSRFGVTVAARLRERSLLRRVFRALFDRVVKRAHQEYARRAVSLGA